MTEQIQSKLIEEEMKESYIDYSMSVIVGRALPDVHDGLKPVHRRILYVMHELGLLHNKPYKKSANVVGSALARYHPHGDIAVYDSLVRMAQNFSLRYTLIDGQGNWGSQDGDNAAAYRYTEARLSKIAEELLADIEKDTVRFIPNFDNSTKEPIVLPSKFPNLIVNGSSGIAVGMATNMPPHNIKEAVDAIIKVIEDPDVQVEQLIELIKGPDFPTGGIILGKRGILNAYKTGRGQIKVRAKVEISKNNLIVTEIPYQVNKSLLIENMADLVRDKRVEGISDIRDESDRKGMHILIQLKQNANPEVVLNQLYKHSQLQETFGVINLALVASQPKVLSLKDLISFYLRHRKRIVTRRVQFELRKAQERAHILEGLKIALVNIDPVIKLIKSSDTVENAKISLIKKFELTELQSNAILEMRLQRLTSLETSKVNKEHESLLKLIIELKSILADEKKIFDIIKNELLELKQKYGDERRTQIIDMDDEEILDEDLIKEETVVVTMTHSGYIKKLPAETYKQQKRGGKGIIATETKDENDFVEHLFITSTHNYILFFTDQGIVYWLKGYKIPTTSRYSKGENIVNILNLKKDEKITAMMPIKEFRENEYLIMLTKKGIIKKTALTEYSNPRKTGVIAINLRENDKLVNVKLTNGEQKYIIATKNGLAVKFNEKDVRVLGRNATGVRAIKLTNDEVIGAEIATNDNDTLLTVTENGYGKRSLISEYRLIKRGGKGVINIKTSGRNGKVVAIKTVKDDHELMLITKKGILIRTGVKDVSVVGRNTQGVRIMKLDANDKLVNIARVINNNH